MLEGANLFPLIVADATKIFETMAKDPCFFFGMFQFFFENFFGGHDHLHECCGLQRSFFGVAARFGELRGDFEQVSASVPGCARSGIGFGHVGQYSTKYWCNF